MFLECVIYMVELECQIMCRAILYLSHRAGTKTFILAITIFVSCQLQQIKAFGGIGGVICHEWIYPWPRLIDLIRCKRCCCSLGFLESALHVTLPFIETGATQTQSTQSSQGLLSQVTCNSHITHLTHTCLGGRITLHQTNSSNIYLDLYQYWISYI